MLNRLWGFNVGASGASGAKKVPSSSEDKNLEITLVQNLVRPLKGAARHLLDHHSIYIEAGKGALKLFLDFHIDGLDVYTGEDAVAWRDTYKENGSIINIPIKKGVTYRKVYSVVMKISSYPSRTLTWNCQHFVQAVRV